METYLAFLGEEFLDELDAARKNTTFVDPAGMTDDCRSRGRQLFAMLNSWTQELTVATKIARGIREQNGWEFWRLLWRKLAPDNHSKNLVWRRALLSPKFPTKITKEADFSPALQEWEADLDKHEAEFGQAKAMSDEDKRAVVLKEAPTALKQNLSMHIGTLTTYQYVREVVVSYLQAKQVCGNHQQRMRVPPHARTLMPWRSVKSVMAKVGVKEKMAKERRARRAKGKNKREKQI